MTDLQWVVGEHSQHCCYGGHEILLHWQRYADSPGIAWYQVFMQCAVYSRCSWWVAYPRTWGLWSSLDGKQSLHFL